MSEKVEYILYTLNINNYKVINGSECKPRNNKLRFSSKPTL